MAYDTTENTAVVTPPAPDALTPIGDKGQVSNAEANNLATLVTAPTETTNPALSTLSTPTPSPELGNLKPLGQAPTLPTSETPAFPQATGTETPTQAPFGQVVEPTAPPAAPDFSQSAESATAQPVESSWTPTASPDSPSTNSMGDQVGTGLGAGEERTIEAPTVSGSSLPPPAALPAQPVATQKSGLMKTLFGWTGLVPD